MKKNGSVDGLIGSLPPIYVYDHLVHMSNGKAYRVYRQGSDGAVIRYMVSQGFNAQDIVKIEMVPPKK